MSGFVSEDSGIAASVYLALYIIFFAFMIYVLTQRGIRTIYTVVFVFAVFRVAGQLCGVVFAKLGPTYWQWLVAYLVLQTEGYFMLILTAFRFTCKAQIDKFGQSWVITTGPLPNNRLTWLRLFLHFLIPANAILVAGGIVTAVNDGSSDQDTAKALRTAGQIIFLLLTLISILLNLHVYVNEGIRDRNTVPVLLAAPFLVVRGVFGVLSIYISEMNYFELSNYLGGEVKRKLVIYEYTLATTMEFIAALLLMVRFFAEEKEREDCVLLKAYSSSSGK